MGTSTQRPRQSTIRIFLIGSPGTGKSTLTSRLEGFPSDPSSSRQSGTQFYSFRSPSIPYYKFQLWDTYNNSLYQQVLLLQFNIADIIIIMFDVTNKKSFLNLSWFFQELKNKNDKKKYMDTCHMLVGSKRDSVKRVVSYQRGEQMAKEMGMEMGYVEVELKREKSMVYFLEMLKDKHERLKVQKK